MRALNLKLVRELWAMRGQALAIAAVIVGGVTTMVMFMSTYDSLIYTRDSYYRENRFAEVFASLKRAPASLVARVQEIPGVEAIEARVVANVKLDVAGFDAPVVGRIIGIPDNAGALLNATYLRRGRNIEPSADSEILLDEAFAEAHGFAPGDTLAAIINGRRRALTVVGIVLSPEYIYQIPPGGFFPDFKRYGVLWMEQRSLASAYDMEGAFNNLTLTLERDANIRGVTERLDELIKPYGGYGSYSRDYQLSNRFLAEELTGLETSATIFPLIFVGVSAFLLNVVLSRLISTERDQIAILKAFGYSDLTIGWHYLKLVLIIVSVGIVCGVALGLYWGRGLSNIYMEFYRFPYMHFLVEGYVIVTAALITMAAAVMGTLHAVYRAVTLPPAEAMRPEAPPDYRATVVERLGLQRWLAQPTRMILRHIERRPVKSTLSVIGLAFAGGIMMVGNFQESAIRFIVTVQFEMSQRDDMTLSFVEPLSRKALFNIRRQPGVIHAEGFRAVPVRFHFGHRSYRTSIQGLQPGGVLMRVLNTELEPLALPQRGLVMTDYLGKLLGIQPGDMVTVEVLEGRQPVLQVPVVALTKQYLGVYGYMQVEALNRLMREGNVISGAYITIDEMARDEVYTQLKSMPQISGTIARKAAIQSFYDTLAETILFFSFIANLLGMAIAFGVVYNTARIALSERGRELASMRVLGFTRGEIAYILLGELFALTLVAIPVGFAVGYGLCAFLAANFQNELYRVPLVVETATYANAAMVILVSTCISSWLIWRQLKRLDLVAVLKTRE